MGLEFEPKDQPTPTHAEAATVVRIEHIADLMRSLRFVRGKTVKRLAAEWGLTEQRVRELSSEASRTVKAEITDPDRVTVTACGYVEWALREAKKTKDTRAIAPLAKAWAELAGTLVQRHDLTLNNVEALSVEQLEQLRGLLEKAQGR